MAFVPPGGKQIPEDSGDIIATAFREVKEETGIDLPTLPGQWLDKKGDITPSPTIVQEESFDLEKVKMIDYLFFFQLAGTYREQYIAEKMGEWHTYHTITRPSIVVHGKAYQLLVPGIREAILDVMKMSTQ